MVLLVAGWIVQLSGKGNMERCYGLVDCANLC